MGRIPQSYTSTFLRLMTLVVGATIVNGCSVTSVGFGSYVYDQSGVRAVYRIPAALIEDEIREVETIRGELAGGPPAHYVYVEVDNRNGTRPFNAAAVEVSSTRGGRVNVQPAAVLLRLWASAAATRAERAQWFARAEEPTFSGVVPPGTAQAVVLGVLRPLEGSIRRIVYEPSGRALQWVQT